MRALLLARREGGLDAVRVPIPSPDSLRASGTALVTVAGCQCQQYARNGSCCRRRGGLTRAPRIAALVARRVHSVRRELRVDLSPIRCGDNERTTHAFAPVQFTFTFTFMMPAIDSWLRNDAILFI